MNIFKSFAEWMGFCFHDWEIVKYNIPENQVEFYELNLAANLIDTYRIPEKGKYWVWRCSKCGNLKPAKKEEVLRDLELRFFDHPVDI